MTSAFPRLNNAVHAYTDLYDEKERTFLIRYPTWLLTTIIVSGVTVFALAGFLDRQGGVLFPDFTPLFLWLCGLIITLQWSIFRNKALTSARWASIITTLVSMAIVALIYYAGLPDFGRLGILSRTIRALIQDLPTFAIINFGLLLIFLVDSIRRWVLCAQGKPFVPRVNIGLGTNSRSSNDDDGPLPKLNELIAGDLIAGGLVILLFALFFSPTTFNLFFANVKPGVVADCTITTGGWGPCITLGSAASFTAPFPGLGSQSLFNDPRLLSFSDILATLVLLIPGLLILAPSVLSSVLGNSPELGTKTTPIPARRESASTGSLSQEVSEEVIETLGAGLTRRFRFSFAIALRDLALRFRHVLWPALILAGVFGAAKYSQYQTYYLHAVRTNDACHTVNGILSCISDSTVAYGFSDQGKALIGAAVALMGIVFSAATLAFSGRVAANSGRFLFLIGFIFALIFWIISLLLSLINFFYYIIAKNTGGSLLQHVTGDAIFKIVAFPQLSFFTTLSLAFFLRYAIPWLIRRIRQGNAGPMVDLAMATGGRRPQPAPATAPTPASPPPTEVPPTDGVG